MATFPSIDPDYNAQKNSAPVNRVVRLVMATNSAQRWESIKTQKNGRSAL